MKAGDWGSGDRDTVMGKGIVQLELGLLALDPRGQGLGCFQAESQSNLSSSCT